MDTWTSVDLQKLGSFEILNTLADGAYVTNTERNILFWNKSAERITGWPASEVVGKSCQDNILVHIDKDGHRLCGREHCPLHRSIVTDTRSAEALLVFAQRRDGSRVPVEVTVAPIHNPDGVVVGGIEVFRDLTAGMADQVRARLIQEHALNCELSADPRLEFSVRYTPNDIVGGDFYRIEHIDANRYAVMIADVMGHGVAAALYTMQLRSLWEDYRDELTSPAGFLGIINNKLHALAREAGYFATAACLTIDAGTGVVQYVRAGHPALLVLRRTGVVEPLTEQQPALGMFPDLKYENKPSQLASGEALLLYTDGAIEIPGTDGEELGVEGLRRLVVEELRTAGKLSLQSLEERLLQLSRQVRLPDDLTLLQLRRAG
jgi:phosphoserine phosphatase RsbU/P